VWLRRAIECHSSAALWLIRSHSQPVVDAGIHMAAGAGPLDARMLRSALVQRLTRHLMAAPPHRYDAAIDESVRCVVYRTSHAYVGLCHSIQSMCACSLSSAQTQHRAVLVGADLLGLLPRRSSPVGLLAAADIGNATHTGSATCASKNPYQSAASIVFGNAALSSTHANATVRALKAKLVDMI
jgi:hypothetical protein